MSKNKIKNKSPLPDVIKGSKLACFYSPQCTHIVALLYSPNTHTSWTSLLPMRQRGGKETEGLRK